MLFRFAALAAQTGDLEGAISALERMLLINPDLPRVRLELGVLYYRLGSYEVARTYLEGGAEVARRAARCARQGRAIHGGIAISEQNRRILAGEAFFGWRYQSNANLGPVDLERAAVRPARQPQPGAAWARPTGAS